MSSDPISGTFGYALELCAALAPRDIEVTLATLGSPVTAAQRSHIATLANVALREGGWRLEWMPDPWEDLERAGEWLLELERETAPNVVHLNHLAHGDLPFRAPVVVVGHSCVLSWWDAVRAGPLPPHWCPYRERVSASLRGADLVAAPTQAMLASLERHYGPLHAVSVIANGRDPRHWSCATKEPFILAAGRLWDETKNIATLCAAAASVRWPILVGPLDRGQLAQLYARAAIYALPARYEPFGVTALEAALSGCALALSDLDGLRELWGDAARYVPAGDPRAWSAALNELADDEALRSRLAERARRRALEFSASRLAADYAQLYRRLAQSGRMEAVHTRLPGPHGRHSGEMRL